MKLVPTYRLIYFVGLIFLPFTLLMVVVPSAAVPNIVLAVASVIVIAMDAYRSRDRLQAIGVMLPEVVRISTGRERNFNLQIENQKPKVRRIRLGLAFPAEIYVPQVELSIKLPKIILFLLLSGRSGA